MRHGQRGAVEGRLVKGHENILTTSIFNCSPGEFPILVTTLGKNSDRRAEGVSGVKIAGRDGKEGEEGLQTRLSVAVQPRSGLQVPAA